VKELQQMTELCNVTQNIKRWGKTTTKNSINSKNTTQLVNQSQHHNFRFKMLSEAKQNETSQ